MAASYSSASMQSLRYHHHHEGLMLWRVLLLLLLPPCICQLAPEGSHYRKKAAFIRKGSGCRAVAWMAPPYQKTCPAANVPPALLLGPHSAMAAPSSLSTGLAAFMPAMAPNKVV
jgi:hypothetical protein